MPLKAIFFDAGNTLIFPNLERTLKPLISRGVRPTTEQLQASERAAKLILDDARMAKKAPAGADAEYWDEYYTHLAQQLHISDPKLVRALIGESRTSANWSEILPGTLESLRRLSDDFRLGIISNSDGGIANILQSVGIADFFESFTDSGLIVHEKPHPAIFAAALKSLGVDPADSVYVGDIYSVDYLGAKAAGMEAILMDVSGTYRGRALARVESLAELEAKLSNGL